MPQTLARLLREERGNSVVEVAIFLACLGPVLLMGTAEIASIAAAAIEIDNAAHVGAMYGMQDATHAADTSSIRAAAQAEAADFGMTVTVTPTTYWACATALSGTTYTTQSSATSNCTGTGNHALEFVKVTTSATVTPPFHVPALLSSYTINGVSVMEVQQ